MILKQVKIVDRNGHYQLHFYNLRGERRRISAGDDIVIAEKLRDEFQAKLDANINPESDTIPVKQDAGKTISQHTIKATFYINSELLKKLRHASIDLEQSQSALVNSAIKNFLET